MDVTVLEEALSQVDKDIALENQNLTQDIPPNKIRRKTRQGPIATDTPTPGRRTRRARKVPRCKVCKERISCRKNFSSKWIIGADSVRVSNVRDHAQNDQHTHVMCLLEK